ncbi:hypothetical protein NERG_01865 [Nematocida ausubeli]|uniref:Uncharacterized protein n=1 Tax=Nematocida ausubeli (strain ATCC PRA-371 / ERTm2) TaxID=1913371 RepID=H8ZE44_NEMA1|nr:hypothetical protein NERG_01865 [Nematocida ausubeli]
MDEEKYSRQIKLFGKDTQEKILASHIHLAGVVEERMESYMIRLLSQVGAHVCRSNECKIEPTWVFVFDLPEAMHESFRAAEQGQKILYISTSNLLVSKAYTQRLNAESTAQHSEVYLNILVGVAVQEYIKSMAGINCSDEWRLDLSIFE